MDHVEQSKKAAGLQPRRTTRIALWGAEEQGLIGFRVYTDHTNSDRTGVPGFQFVQEWLEYNSRTHTSTALHGERCPGNQLRAHC